MLRSHSCPRLTNIKSLADADLGWDVPGEGEFPARTVRTDAIGEALIPLAKAGLMTFRLTHMSRPKTAENDWESFWTIPTFYLSTPESEPRSAKQTRPLHPQRAAQQKRHTAANNRPGTPSSSTATCKYTDVVTSEACPAAALTSASVRPPARA
jgi:hypothetical protein